MSFYALSAHVLLLSAY